MDRRTLLGAATGALGYFSIQKLAEPEPAEASTRTKPIEFWESRFSGGDLDQFNFYLAATGNRFRGQAVRLNSIPTSVIGHRVRGKLNKRGQLDMRFFDLPDYRFETPVATSLARKNKAGAYSGEVFFNGRPSEYELQRIQLSKSATRALSGSYLIELQDRKNDRIAARSLLNARPDCTFSLEHVWVDRNNYPVLPPPSIVGRWGAREDGGVYSATSLDHLDFGDYPDGCEPFEAQNLFVPPNQPKFPHYFDAFCGYFFCLTLMYGSRQEL